MQTKMLKNILKMSAFAGLLLTAGLASAQVVNLEVREFEKQIPDGNGGTYPVTMWGFAECDEDFVCDNPPTSPGPQIDATAGQPLTINIRNTLPRMPVSIMVPGQIQDAGGNPEQMPSAPTRVGSMTHEAAPETGTATYTFTSPKAGTFIYQSASYPSLEVPMGLYGALVVRPAASACTNASESAAYTLPTGGTDQESCFSRESVLLFSEIDLIQNQRVSDAVDPNVGNLDPTTACVPIARYAKTMETGFPCTLDYNPTLLLVNGEPGVDLGATAAGVPAGSLVLLRMINAGLHSHTPSTVGTELRLLAEDGNRYPGPVTRQSAVLLAAGKTIDALIPAPADANTNLSFFDRMPTFSNENAPNGGSLGTVFGPGAVAPPPTAITTSADVFAFDENNSLADKNVLDNDIGAFDATVSIDGATPAGLTLNADGTLSYVAGANEIGTVSFSYIATGSLGTSASTPVQINVSFTNSDPIANDDAYSNAIGTIIDVAAPGVLANDNDPDGDSLVAALETAPAGTISCVNELAGTVTPNVICEDGSFSYEPTGPGDDSFTYTVTDGNGAPVEATVSLHVNPVANITLRVVDENNVVVDDFRWTVEEDTMWQPNPDIPQSPEATMGANFHKSYMPVVAQGVGNADFNQLALDPTKHYYVSVLPSGSAGDTEWELTHGMGGARIYPNTATTTVEVGVNTQPTPYAQISIFVFNDNAPTNGAVDGGEQGLGGFQVTLEDAGGRYGASAGMMFQDADGNPLRNALPCFGPTFDQLQDKDGLILSCPEGSATPGEVLIQNLWPGKYGVIVTPPTDQSTDWAQTSTIEGTKVIDAWVKADEPPFFQEFGPAGWHVFTGFVNPGSLVNPANSDTFTGTTSTISGQVTNMHMSKPPNQTLVDSGSYAALAHTRAWVGLNSAGGVGANIAAVQANADGTFTLPAIPDGQNYQLVVWDSYLDQVIAFQGVNVPTGAGAVDVGTVPVFQWFARLENSVFLDENADGVFDEGSELPMLEQNVNIRWRDGTVYQAAPTDTEGFVPFDQVFPFFHWLVAEVDYARFKPTGITATVDGGGVPDAGGILNPNWPDGSPTTFTQTGPVLTQGFQAFLGQTNVINWGKKPWTPGENGGISGIVYYASTRAENDPRLGVGEPWEPGVPSVTVRLYKEVVRPDGLMALTLVEETQTDSWDDSLPFGCPGADPADVDIVGLDPVTAQNTKCYDGMRNFNQIRDAVFDGGYAFGAECDLLNAPDACLEPGVYVVEVEAPPGYEIVKEEDVNVGFGEGYGTAPVTVPLPNGAVAAAVPDAAIVAAALAPEPGLAQPPCVGELRMVPETLSLFPAAQVEAPFAGASRPLCDRKEVILSDQGQAAADFWLFTGAPIAGHFAGMVLDDTAQEFNPKSVQFGEKWAPPFVPVSVRDYRGREISRTYTDQWGRMNALVPSTFTANTPSPSGFSPSMLMTCMNDPGPIMDPASPDPQNPNMIIDPQFNPAYSNFCYTFQYMPGATTYLDTPVVPVSAFASGYNPPDCEPEAGVPKLHRAESTSGDGPYVLLGGTLTLTSQGITTVPNPAYEGPLATGAAAAETKTITRDFGFGPEGTVTLDGTPITVTWSDSTITWQVSDDPDDPAYVAPGEYQLMVTNGAGNSTADAITVYVDDGAAPLFNPSWIVEGQLIQAAIDQAADGDLIIVGPGTYEEMVILWKPVRLQGSGAGSTLINGAKRPTDALLDWRDKMDCLFGVNATGCNGATFGAADPLPNQPAGAAGFDTEEGAPITVVGSASGNYSTGAPARIDGFSLTGGDSGGGLFVNGYAHRLRVTNNRVFGNSGLWHGGIRVGRPFLELPAPGLTGGGNPRLIPYGFNENIRIAYNSVTQNGGLDGVGGGISLMTGTDTYRVSNNYVCGNFTQGDGAGIGHLGLSNDGRITDNTVIFNQSFLQQAQVSGGGVFVGGEPPAAADEVTAGTGNVRVERNLIQGNQAASGHGGGVRAQYVNGFDVVNLRRSRWYDVRINGNTIVNNVAGFSGGGVSLQDTVNGQIRNNTIANNDSTATVAATFVNGADAPSVKQPAGISSEPHTTSLAGALPTGGNNAPAPFSDPTMSGNVIAENRSFHYEVVAGEAMLMPALTQSSVGACEGTPVYDDLGVLGGNGYTLDPGNSILTDPGFVAPYCNGGRSLVGEPGPMLAVPALDEGGATWIEVRYGPLQLTGDYSY